jgi:hypothetical protein
LSALCRNSRNSSRDEWTGIAVLPFTGGSTIGLSATNAWALGPLSVMKGG